MPFSYPRTIRFHETDGAGVVYFATVLSLCHEAYEASLVAAGIEVQAFFSPVGSVVPIVHASVDFFKPLRCGDRIQIHLTPTRLSENSFTITYEMFQPEAFLSQELPTQRPLVQALTRHVCIQADSRQRQLLKPVLEQWLERYCAHDAARN